MLEAKLGVHFSQCLQGVLNNQIVAGALAASFFLRSSVAARYSASPARSMFVQTECLPLTSENGIHQTSLRGISTKTK